MSNISLVTIMAIVLLLNGCKKEENKPAVTTQATAVEITPKSFHRDAEEDLREIQRLALAAKNKATASKAQSAFSQWASGIARYKQTYGFYPNIGGSYEVSSDTVHQLDNPTINLRFVKALSGKLPTGIPLSQEDRRKLNRNMEEFCSFERSDFDDLPNLAERCMLVDRFGNNKIRVILDTDNNTLIRNIRAKDLPEEISAAATAGGIKARIIIYTKGENGAPDVVAIQ